MLDILCNAITGSEIGDAGMTAGRRGDEDHVTQPAVMDACTEQHPSRPSRNAVVPARFNDCHVQDSRIRIKQKNLRPTSPCSPDLNTALLNRGCG